MAIGKTKLLPSGLGVRRPLPSWARALALAALLVLPTACALLTGEARRAEVPPPSSDAAAMSEAEVEALANIAPAAGSAAISPERAVLFIKSLSDRTIATMADESLAPEQRASAVRLILLQGFDVDAISRIVLGRYWRQATPAQRSEYRRLFEDFIVAVYMSRFGKYSGETLAVTGAHLSKRNIVVVNSLVQRPRPGMPPVGVDWLVRDSGAGPRIIDVVVGGVSMAITQRSDFASIIQSNGGNVEGLLAELRARTT